MTNYVMSKGRKERRIRIAKRIVLWSLIFWGIYSFLAWTDKRDMKLLGVDFCDKETSSYRPEECNNN